MLLHRIFGLWLAVLSVAAAASFTITPARLPTGFLGTAYSGGPLQALGGALCPQNHVTFTVVGGAPPPGVELLPSGVFRGVPVEPGSYAFLVRVTNACGWSDQEVRIEVSGAPLLLVNPAELHYQILEGQALGEVATLRLTGSQPSLPYTLEMSASAWLRAQPRDGRLPGPGSAFATDVIEVRFDTAHLYPGKHRGWLKLSAWRTPMAVTVPVSVTVTPRPLETTSLPMKGPVELHPVPPIVIPAPSRPAPEVIHPPVEARPPALKSRLSRSAEFRSRFMPEKAGVKPADAAKPVASPKAVPGAKPAPATKPTAKAAAAGADPGKPSPLGKPVPGAPAAPPARPPAAPPAKPEAKSGSAQAPKAEAKPPAPAPDSHKQNTQKKAADHKAAKH